MPIPGVPRTYVNAREVPRVPRTDPPSQRPTETVVVASGRWRAVIPASILSAAIGFAGSMMAQPHVDMSRIERKIDDLDSKVGALSDKVDTNNTATRERQMTDSNLFSNDIARAAGRLDRHDDRLAEIARRIEAVEHGVK
jgi:peptidoglycan hydrolase CwlO-like protein